MTDLLTVKAERLMITMPDGSIIDPRIGEPYASEIVAANAPRVSAADQFIASANPEALVGLVMKLTGGSVSPSLVRNQIDAAKKRNIITNS